MSHVSLINGVSIGAFGFTFWQQKVTKDKLFTKTTKKLSVERPNNVCKE